MPNRTEAMLFCHLGNQQFELLVVKLDQHLALLAMQMIVRWVPVIKLVDRSAIELKAAEQACVDKFLERPVDRRTRDIIGVALAGQLVDQLIGVKVLMLTEYPLHQKTPLVGVPQPSTLQVLLEPLQGTHRNGDRTQAAGIGPFDIQATTDRFIAGHAWSLFVPKNFPRKATRYYG